jgi:hypothetical protein
MLIPVDADTPMQNSNNTQQEISEILDMSKRNAQQQEQLRRQNQIQKLIPQIKEPIIL